MKKIYELDQKLEKLQSQKIALDSIENISIIQFIKYRTNLSKEKRILNKLHKLNLLAKEVNFLYDINTKSWIANPQINCRKYYKMEQNASYKKDLTLYKLGILKEKPKSPFIQTIKKYLPKLDYSKFNFFNKLRNQINYFTSHILPRKINNIAISTTKAGIKSYRKLQLNCRFIRSSFANKNSVKYLKSVIDEANRQISISEKRNMFIDSLRFNPTNFHSNQYNDNHEKISQTPKIIQKKSISNYEYSL